MADLKLKPISKLDELSTDNRLRQKAAAIVGTLRNKLDETTDIIEAKRSPAEQQKKINSGVSQTKNSFHVKRGSDGGALAADIAPRSVGWNASKRFWLMLGWLAYTKELGWGGLFGIKPAQRAKVLAAMETLSKAGWPKQHELYKIAIGWDPAHIQSSNNWPK